LALAFYFQCLFHKLTSWKVPWQIIKSMHFLHVNIDALILSFVSKVTLFRASISSLKTFCKLYILLHFVIYATKGLSVFLSNVYLYTWAHATKATTPHTYLCLILQTCIECRVVRKICNFRDKWYSS
jgi:hypothetical protein